MYCMTHERHFYSELSDSSKASYSNHVPSNLLNDLEVMEKASTK